MSSTEGSGSQPTLRQTWINQVQKKDARRKLVDLGVSGTVGQILAPKQLQGRTVTAHTGSTEASGEDFVTDLAKKVKNGEGGVASEVQIKSGDGSGTLETRTIILLDKESVKKLGLSDSKAKIVDQETGEIRTLRDDELGLRAKTKLQEGIDSSAGGRTLSLKEMIALKAQLRTGGDIRVATKESREAEEARQQAEREKIERGEKSSYTGVDADSERKQQLDTSSTILVLGDDEKVSEQAGAGAGTAEQSTKVVHDLFHKILVDTVKDTLVEAGHEAKSETFSSLLNRFKTEAEVNISDSSTDVGDVAEVGAGQVEVESEVVSAPGASSTLAADVAGFEEASAEGKATIAEVVAHSFVERMVAGAADRKSEARAERSEKKEVNKQDEKKRATLHQLIREEVLKAGILKALTETDRKLGDMSDAVLDEFYDALVVKIEERVESRTRYDESEEVRKETGELQEVAAEAAIEDQELWQDVKDAFHLASSTLPGSSDVVEKPKGDAYG